MGKYTIDLTEKEYYHLLDVIRSTKKGVYINETFDLINKIITQVANNNGA